MKKEKLNADKKLRNPALMPSTRSHNLKMSKLPMFNPNLTEHNKHFFFVIKHHSHPFLLGNNAMPFFFIIYSSYAMFMFMLCYAKGVPSSLHSGHVHRCSEYIPQDKTTKCASFSRFLSRAGSTTRALQYLSSLSTHTPKSVMLSHLSLNTVTKIHGLAIIYDGQTSQHCPGHQHDLVQK